MEKKIYMTNGKMWEVAESCELDNSITCDGIDTSLSRSLGDIVERYLTFINITKVPSLTDEEALLLGNVVVGMVVCKQALEILDSSILDAYGDGPNTDVEIKNLYEKVKQWSLAERLAFVEAITPSYGQ